MARRRLRRYYPRFRRFRRRGKGSMTIPIAVVGGAVAGVVETIPYLMDGRFDMAGELLVRNYTGWSIKENKWYYPYAQRGLMPLLIGMIIHVLASKLGVNRMLGRARVPFLRI